MNGTSNIKLSIIVPTLGRKTLDNTLRSCYYQLSSTDEIIVVADGPEAYEGLPERVKAYDRRVRVISIDKAGKYGNPARDCGISCASGSHLLFMDDDDIYTKDSIEKIRKAVTEEPDIPHVFRMKYGPGADFPRGSVLWSFPDLRVGNIGTPMFVTPKYHNLPKWADYYDAISDFRFIHATWSLVKNARFHPDIICVVRPGEEELIEEDIHVRDYQS